MVELILGVLLVPVFIFVFFSDYLYLWFWSKKRGYIQPDFPDAWATEAFRKYASPEMGAALDDISE